MDGANYYFSKEDSYEEPFSFFQLSLLSSRKLRKEGLSFGCPLCEVKDKEICLKKLKYGGFFFNKYPIVDKSYLYISCQHKNLINKEDLFDIRQLILENPNLLLFSNMDGISSLPDHFHLECIASSYIPKVITNKLKLSILSDVGIGENFYVDFIYFDLENISNLDRFLIFYKILKYKGFRFNIIFFHNYLLIHILKKKLISLESIDCSARTFLGLFSTSDPNKFEDMRSKGLLRILKENTLSKTSLGKLFSEFVEGVG